MEWLCLPGLTPDTTWQVLKFLTFDRLIWLAARARRELPDDFWVIKVKFDFPRGEAMLYDPKKLAAYQRNIEEGTWNWQRRYVFFALEASITEASLPYLSPETSLRRLVWSGQHELLPIWIKRTFMCKWTTDRSPSMRTSYEFIKEVLPRYRLQCYSFTQFVEDSIKFGIYLPDALEMTLEESSVLGLMFDMMNGCLNADHGELAIKYSPWNIKTIEQLFTPDVKGRTRISACLFLVTSNAPEEELFRMLSNDEAMIELCACHALILGNLDLAGKLVNLLPPIFPSTTCFNIEKMKRFLERFGEIEFDPKFKGEVEAFLLKNSKSWIEQMLDRLDNVFWNHIEIIIELIKQHLNSRTPIELIARIPRFRQTNPNVLFEAALLSCDPSVILPINKRFVKDYGHRIRLNKASYLQDTTIEMACIAADYFDLTGIKNEISDPYVRNIIKRRSSMPLK